MQLTPDQNRLIEQNTGLAISIATQVWRASPPSAALELQELVSLAYLALVQASVRWPAYCREHGYDPAAESYFVAYAQRRIKGGIHDSMRAQDYAKRSDRDRFKQLESAGQSEGLSEQELSERTGLTVREIRSTHANLARRPVSIEANDLDFDNERDVEREWVENKICATLVETVELLPEPMQAVLALHYFGDKELREVARVMGITESRASHLHTDAVLAVQAALRRVLEERQGAVGLRPQQVS